MTKICLPTLGSAGLDEEVCEHFGRALTYTFVDSDAGGVEVVQNNTLHMGGQGYPPDLIGGFGAEVMLCGALGRRAVSMFEDRGIAVYLGASGSVRDAISLWQAGRLELAGIQTACQEHEYRDEEHGDGHHHHE